MTQKRLRELENEWSGCGGWEAIVEIAGALRASHAENARLADEAARLRAALDDLATKASIVVSSEFGGNDPEEGPHCVQQLDLAIDQARRLILASPASEAVARRAAERELAEAARELADEVDAWTNADTPPEVTRDVIDDALQAYRDKLAAKEGA